MSARVTAVAANPVYSFSKPLRETIRIVAGHGVEGDVHAGMTVKHRSRIAVDPTQPNLRQVHLMACELFDDLARAGFAINPGDLGENVTTCGLDLLGLGVGTLLHLGQGAIVEITGLRNPCQQIEAFRPGLLAQVVSRGADGALIRRAGIMAIAIATGEVKPGDAIAVEVPAGPHRPLDRV